MKRKISLILCFSMILNAFFININAVTDEKANFQETTTEVSFENTSEISSELSAGSETSSELTYELDKDDISDAGIDKVLEHEGLLGLSKKQYVQYLMKHYKNADFEEDQALMEYTGTTLEFKEKYITKNSKIIAIEECSTEDNYVVYFKGKSQNLVINMMRKLAKDDKVIHIQPNFRYYPCAVPEGYSYTQATNIAYEQIEAPGAWDYATGAGVKVGVIDTGVIYFKKQDGTHILYPNKDLSNKFGSHQNGKCSFSDCRFNEHGTNVASIIGKRYTSNINFVGLAYNCEIISYNVLDKYNAENNNESFSSNSIQDAISQAQKDGIKILNGSFGYDSTSSNYKGFEFDKNVLEKIKNYNGLFVKSAGNGNHNDNLCTDKNSYKNVPNLIIVGAVDQYDNLYYNSPSSGSDYGLETVHITAPGYMSVLNGSGQTIEGWGTSYAAPLVTATAALMLEVNPNLTPAQLKTKILENADVVPKLQAKIQGARRLNVKKAVKSVVTDASKLRIATLDNNGTLKVKEGTHNANWAITDYSVSDFQLEGKKLGIIQGGKLKIKEGALNSYWDLVAENVKSFKMKGNTIAVLLNTNALKLYKKNGSTYTLLRTISNVKSFDMEGNRVAYISNSSSYSYTIEDGFPSIYDLYINTADSVWLKGNLIQVLHSGGYKLYGKTNNKYMKLSVPSISQCSTTTNRTMLTVPNDATYLYEFNSNTEYVKGAIAPAYAKAVKSDKYKLYYIGTDENVLYYQQGAALSSSWIPIKWNVNSFYIADGYTGVVTTNGTFSIIPDNSTWQEIAYNIKKAQILY